MNKYLTLSIALALLIVSGIVYRQFLLPDAQKPVDTGVVKEFTITIEKNSWTFAPETIDVDIGDTVKLKFVNLDDYDHGVGIDAYGVSQRIPARATLDVPAFLASKAGDFQFYCSVSCSAGIAESGAHKGLERSHFDQIGTLCVHQTPGDRVCKNSSPATPTTPPVVSGGVSTAGVTTPEVGSNESSVKSNPAKVILSKEACKGVGQPPIICLGGNAMTCIAGIDNKPTWACAPIQ